MATITDAFQDIFWPILLVAVHLRHDPLAIKELIVYRSVLSKTFLLQLNLSQIKWNRLHVSKLTFKHGFSISDQFLPVSAPLLHARNKFSDLTSDIFNYISFLSNWWSKWEWLISCIACKSSTIVCVTDAYSKNWLPATLNKAKLFEKRDSSARSGKTSAGSPSLSSVMSPVKSPSDTEIFSACSRVCSSYTGFCSHCYVV